MECAQVVEGHVNQSLVQLLASELSSAFVKALSQVATLRDQRSGHQWELLIQRSLGLHVQQVVDRHGASRLGEHVEYMSTNPSLYHGYEEGWHRRSSGNHNPNKHSPLHAFSIVCCGNSYTAKGEHAQSRQVVGVRA